MIFTDFDMEGKYIFLHFFKALNKKHIKLACVCENISLSGAQALLLFMFWFTELADFWPDLHTSHL